MIIFNTKKKFNILQKLILIGFYRFLLSFIELWRTWRGICQHGLNVFNALYLKNVEF